MSSFEGLPFTGRMFNPKRKCFMGLIKHSYRAEETNLNNHKVQKKNLEKN